MLPENQGNLSMLYLLNSPVLTAYGDIAISQLRWPRQRACWQRNSSLRSGMPPTAEFLSGLLQVRIPLNRIAVTMQPGDRALVLSLKTRLPEGVVIDAAALQNTPYEPSILERAA